MAIVTEQIPATCVNGHELGPGRVLLGWMSCFCKGSKYGGHRTLQCQTCWRRMFKPPHDLAHSPL